MSHMQAWPLPEQDQDVVLPFFGEMISFSVPILSCYLDMGVETDRRALLTQNTRADVNVDSPLPFTSPGCGGDYSNGPEKSHPNTIYSNNKSSTYGLGGGSGMFADDNLVDIFKPLGLLPHLWTLWELVITGKNIVVWSPSADECSKVVTALVSLCAPLVFGGDFRPYINPYDSDIPAISKALSDRIAYVERLHRDISSDSGESIGVSGSVLAKNEKEGGGIGDISLPWEYKLQSFNRQAQGLEVSGGAVGTCFGGEDGATSSAASSSPGSSGAPPSVIIGVTNPFLLKTFSNVDAALFLPLASPKPTSPFSGSRLRKHSLFSSRVSSLDTNASGKLNERKQGPEMNGSAAIPIPLQRNRTTDGRIQNQVCVSGFESDAVTKPPLPTSFLDIPPPPLLHPSQSDSTYGHFSRTGSRSIRSHGCNVNRIDMATPMDLVFERWSSAGGVGTSDARGNTLLTLRTGVCVKPDQTMLHRLLHSSLDPASPAGSMTSSPTASLTHSPTTGDSGTGYGFLGSLLGDLGGVLGAPPELPQADGVQAVMGNMLIREHFRQLTHALMKPFESHFQGSLGAIPPRPTAAGCGRVSPFSYYTGADSSSDRGISSYNMNEDLQNSGSTMNGNYGIIVPPPGQPASSIVDDSSGFWQSSGISLLDPFYSSEGKRPTANCTPPLPSPSGSSSGNVRSTFSALKKDKPGNAAARLKLALDTSSARSSPEPGTSSQGNTTNENLISMSPSRRGASSLWLYRNPSDLLGRRTMNETVQHYLAGRLSKNTPEAFMLSKRQELFTSFGLSHTFQNYYYWRKSELNTAILLDISQACSSLSGQELIEQLAIEQGSDILTQAQMQDLATRISMYILAISSEHNKYCGYDKLSATVTQCDNSESYTPDKQVADNDSSGLRSAMENRKAQCSHPSMEIETPMCVCCRHFQQYHRHATFSTTTDIINKMQDHLNAVMAHIHGDRSSSNIQVEKDTKKQEVSI